MINKLIKKYSSELDLKSSRIGYNQIGKGVKRKLRFSKSGDKTIEDRYATHYIDKNRMVELKDKKASMISFGLRVGFSRDLTMCMVAKC